MKKKFYVVSIVMGLLVVGSSLYMNRVIGAESGSVSSVTTGIVPTLQQDEQPLRTTAPEKIEGKTRLLLAQGNPAEEAARAEAAVRRESRHSQQQRSARGTMMNNLQANPGRPAQQMMRQGAREASRFNKQMPANARGNMMNPGGGAGMVGH